MAHHTEKYKNPSAWFKTIKVQRTNYDEEYEIFFPFGTKLTQDRPSHSIVKHKKLFYIMIDGNNINIEKETGGGTFLDMIHYVQSQVPNKGDWYFWDNLNSDMPIVAISTKTYGDGNGFPVAYRQPLAESHCNLIHGYNMKFHFEFECCELDARNWCVDYGSLRSVKEFLQFAFDHKTLLAKTDPYYADIMKLQELGIAKITEVDATGCEALAQYLWDWMEEWLIENGYSPRVRMHRVEVRETENNMAYITR